MYPIPTTKTLVETKTCRHCSASFPITDKDMEFYEKVSPIFNDKKYNIPSPTLCPDCRQQRRLSFRNERKLYKRKCDATGRDIISIYSPDKPFKVYHQDFWWSDKWDPMEYGRDFDFGKGFFEQFGELMMEVPQLAMVHINCENSDYTNFILNSQNCYMCAGGGNNQSCLYCTITSDCENNMDCWTVFKSQHCYECRSSENCYACFHSSNISGCTNCIYTEECLDCADCILCYGIQNKKNYFLNKEVSKEEIQNLKNNILNGTMNPEWMREYEEIKIQYPRIYMHSFRSEWCTWEVIIESKDCVNAYDINGCENCKNIMYMHNAHHSMDCDYASPHGANYSYNICSSTGTCNSLGTFLCWRNERLYYSINCFDSSYLFGCIGLKNKQYCILNKQYTREEYETLVPRIIEHMRATWEWGEFFPSSLSPFGYNETVAMEYYPLDPPSPTLPPEGEGGSKSLLVSFSPWGKDAWKADRGTFNWSFYEAPFPKVEKIIPADKLPDNISKIPDDILNWAIECEVTKKPFRIIKQELDFYRKHNLPIPRRHPDQRHLDRMALRNPRKLFERKCDKCGKDMVTTYAPDRKEIVYCEECYNTAVIG